MDNLEFSEWYNDLVDKAGLSDKRYPIKGMNVWTPYGWKAMSLIDGLIRREMDGTEHDEVYFPLLIPKTEFQKEKDHIKGFDAEVYWVTHAGENELDVPMLLRPTSETAIYPMFNLWVRSHADLPLKIFQIVNTFRYETKMTRSFIRVREIHFFESHTCHVDFEDAERQIAEDIEILGRLAKDLCLPYILTKRPDWDKFAGAFYTIGIDTPMPTGRTLQLGSIHQYMENFSVPYDIKYEDEQGGHKHVHQTTYGMSERLLGAIVGVHGDEKGLIFPPSVAPYQVVIVPILAKGSQEKVAEAARALKAEVKALGYRVHLDERDIRPGNKFYDWELKGVPLRMELGMRDMEKGAVMLARRDNGEKTQVERSALADALASAMQAIAANLLEKASARMASFITPIRLIDEAEGDKIFKMGWCGSEDCGHEVEDRAELTILGTPVPEEEPAGECAACGAPAKHVIYAARTY